MQMKNVEDVYPLSPMQEGMLFHSVYAPQSEVYFEQVTCILRGKLDVSAFKQAWQRVVARHPILRTCFLWERLEEHLQVVRQQVELPWSEHDWMALPSHEQQQRLQQWLQADRARGFDLARAPLLRFSLIRLSEHVYYFIWSFHHLLLDGWSTSMVLGEVFACYEAMAQGRTFSPPASRPYRDYIAWLQQQDLSQARAFWSRVLQGFTVPTPLGVDRPLPQAGESASDYHNQLFRIPATTIDGLQQLARQQQLTLNTLMQGAWALLLSRYSGRQDVVFGTIVSGRPATLAGVESMVGLFINTLPVRVQLSAHERLIAWLQRLQAQQAEARQYEYSPLVQVQSWSEIPRGQSLFESLLVFENFPVDASLKQEGSLEVEHTLVREWTNYPLTVTLIPGAGMLVRISYMGSRLDADIIERLAQHFQAILESMLAQPEQRLATTSLLTGRERQQLLVDWTQTLPYQSDKCLHSLFEEQVEQTPESIALVFEEHQLTYREVNQRANRLAHALQRLGVEPEICVGLCLERSLELLIAILGILKAGGAYVPLDPNYPMERLTFILQDAQMGVLLSQEHLVERLPSQQCQVLCLDRDWPDVATQPASNPRVSLHPGNLAYVIYTSGSTGTPKGVLITHRHVARLFASAQDLFHFERGDRWTLFHSIAFDFSVWELWGALLYGGRLVVVPYWQSRSPQSVVALLAIQQITVLNQTPSAFRQLVGVEEEALREAAKTLRLIIFGGEALDMASVQSWFARCGQSDAQLVNMYGITETTVHVTALPLSMQTVRSGMQSPIGRPLPDLAVYVLDEWGQPVPIGVTGEIYVAGAGVARGYLNRPELTAERFVPHPFVGTSYDESGSDSASEPGARLYRTGDLARYTAEGQLEYVGRNDGQIKLRGFRIEVGEIEAVLAQHPSVRDALVMLREDVLGDTRLVAYVMTDQEHSITSGELRRYLQQRLPEYMLPSAFMALETFPLTPNGKVDREALPRPDQLRSEHKSAYVAPRTPIEEGLTLIWEQVLCRERIGIYENFLDLGGSSLLATQIIARIRQTFQVELSLRSLLQPATIAALSEGVEAARQSKQQMRIPAIKRLTRSPL